MILELFLIGLVVYYFTKDPSHMNDWETEFISEYGRRGGHRIVRLKFDYRNTALLMKLCKKQAKKKELYERPPRKEIHFLAFKKEEHPPFKVEMIRCKEKYAIIHAPGHHCAYVLKKGKKHKEVPGTLFYFKAKFCYHPPPYHHSADDTQSEMEEAEKRGYQKRNVYYSRSPQRRRGREYDEQEDRRVYDSYYEYDFPEKIRNYPPYDNSQYKYHPRSYTRPLVQEYQPKPSYKVKAHPPLQREYYPVTTAPDQFEMNDPYIPYEKKSQPASNKYRSQNYLPQDYPLPQIQNEYYPILLGKSKYRPETSYKVKTDLPYSNQFKEKETFSNHPKQSLPNVQSRPDKYELHYEMKNHQPPRKFPNTKQPYDYYDLHNYYANNKYGETRPPVRGRTHALPYKESNQHALENFKYETHRPPLYYTPYENQPKTRYTEGRVGPNYHPHNYQHPPLQYHPLQTHLPHAERYYQPSSKQPPTRRSYGVRDHQPPLPENHQSASIETVCDVCGNTEGQPSHENHTQPEGNHQALPIEFQQPATVETVCDVCGNNEHQPSDKPQLQEEIEPTVCDVCGNEEDKILLHPTENNNLPPYDANPPPSRKTKTCDVCGEEPLSPKLDIDKTKDPRLLPNLEPPLFYTSSTGKKNRSKASKESQTSRQQRPQVQSIFKKPKPVKYPIYGQNGFQNTVSESDTDFYGLRLHYGGKSYQSDPEYTIKEKLPSDYFASYNGQQPPVTKVYPSYEGQSPYSPDGQQMEGNSFPYGMKKPSHYRTLRRSRTAHQLGRQEEYRQSSYKDQLDNQQIKVKPSLHHKPQLETETEDQERELEGLVPGQPSRKRYYISESSIGDEAVLEPSNSHQALPNVLVDAVNQGKKGEPTLNKNETPHEYHRKNDKEKSSTFHPISSQKSHKDVSNSSLRKNKLQLKIHEPSPAVKKQLTPPVEHEAGTGDLEEDEVSSPHPTTSRKNANNPSSERNKLQLKIHEPSPAVKKQLTPPLEHEEGTDDLEEDEVSSPHPTTSRKNANNPSSERKKLQLKTHEPSSRVKKQENSPSEHEVSDNSETDEAGFLSSLPDPTTLKKHPENANNPSSGRNKLQPKIHKTSLEAKQQEERSNNSEEDEVGLVTKRRPRPADSGVLSQPKNEKPTQGLDHTATTNIIVDEDTSTTVDEEMEMETREAVQTWLNTSLITAQQQPLPEDDQIHISPENSDYYTDEFEKIQSPARNKQHVSKHPIDDNDEQYHSVNEN